MKRYVALMMVALLVLGLVPGGALANPFYPYVPGLAEAIKEAEQLGVVSTDKLNTIYVDFSEASNGTVVSTVYSRDEQIKDVNNHSVIAQTYNDAWGKAAHFAIYLLNEYHEEAAISIGPYDYNGLSVRYNVYGPAKDTLTYAFISGLTECIGNPKIDLGGSGGGGSSSWVSNYTPDVMSSKTITSFKIGDATYTVNGTIQTMDVTPEVKNSRTYVPVRYLANSLGVTNEDITWDSQTETATLKKDDTTLSLTMGSNTLTATTDGETSSITMDTVPYIKKGRIMLPARWVAEPLGATVTWDEITQQATIEIPTEQGQ